WDWEELVRCQLGDAARDGIHGALPGLPSLGGGEEESPVSSSEASTGGGGYLEDAVAQWGDRSKRQRTAVEGPPRCPAMASEDLQCLLQSFWDSSSGEGALLHDLNTMAPAPAPETSGFLSEEGAASGRGQRSLWSGGRAPASLLRHGCCCSPATAAKGNYRERQRQRQ
uniref:Uncharacterized protein n=1 Tax=Aegilops tauschii subsp. strangulata TaxID=200361 RepID=A0A453PPH3_AEGTS